MYKDNKSQHLGSRANIRRLLEEKDRDFLEIIDKEDVKKFANVYTNIGNVIPIWPGGNSFKGTVNIDGSYIYDIPDIFLKKYWKMEEIYLVKYLNIKVEDAVINISKKNTIIDKYDFNISNMLSNMEMEEYDEFVREVAGIIEQRTNTIKERLCKKQKPLFH